MQMHYYQKYHLLKKAFELPQASVQVAELGVDILHIDMQSHAANHILEGSESLSCEQHNISFNDNHPKPNDSTPCTLTTVDNAIEENKNFQYHIVKDSKVAEVQEVILMLHGLNEKKWDKYLPWAYELVKDTQTAVILFPIGFHMDRAPLDWSERGKMFPIAQGRMMDGTDNVGASFVNAALSSRMEAYPQRIFWSGLQTYSDIVWLLDQIKAGKVAGINKDSAINVFGYSIGSFLSMILMMANPKGYLSEAKLFCFCGGMTIDRMQPISKYIMDSNAAIAMQKVFASLEISDFLSDERLAHYQDRHLHPEESWFKIMLFYHYHQAEREARIKEMSGRIKAMVLKQDVVTPAVEALNTLQGGYRDIPTDVAVVDFQFPYTHMVPFSVMPKYATEVDDAMATMINSAKQFYQQ